MIKLSRSKQVAIIVGVFIVSRMIAMGLGLHLGTLALYEYWQYLDVETLRHHLLTGLWYDHAQPPLFNLFLGIVLKTAGGKTMILFAIIMKLISLANALLIFAITRKLTTVGFLPLLVAVIYIISPATLAFECELFYTTFVSLFLLLSVFYLIRLTENGTVGNAIALVLPMVILCLTRSSYHIAWLFIVSAMLIYYFRRKKIFNRLLIICIAGLLIVGSWYVKNKILFGKLTTSTWIGMNMARNVFHDNSVTDSSRIEAYEAFSDIRVYRKFLDLSYENRYRGLYDYELLRDVKNDSFRNLHEVSYIQVSDLYQVASMDYIRKHPGAYAKNVFQSSILYFTPATMYSLASESAGRLKYYDIPYSFNLSYFANSKQQRRILLTISAMPKLLLYLFVFFVLIKYSVVSRTLSSWNLFIMVTIGFIFLLSSLFEHYENMRFRFETEPLFLILAAQVFSRLYSRFEIRRRPRVSELIA
jgi:hypothetical protein